MALNLSTGFRTALLAGNSWKSQLDGGVIQIYTGTQPDNADLAATGTLLGTISIAAGAWTAGQPSNGLIYEQAGVYIQKPDGANWYLKTIADGVAGWFRVVGNAPDSGDSILLPRMDGAISTSADPAEMIWDVTTLAAAATYRLDSFLFTFPPI